MTAGDVDDRLARTRLRVTQSRASILRSRQRITGSLSLMAALTGLHVSDELSGRRSMGVPRHPGGTLAQVHQRQIELEVRLTMQGLARRG